MIPNELLLSKFHLLTLKNIPFLTYFARLAVAFPEVIFVYVFIWYFQWNNFYTTALGESVSHVDIWVMYFA